VTAPLSLQSNVDDDVVAAIYSSSTQIRRRVEIYESDGISPWQPGMVPRAIDGNVAVSTASNIRRNLDLTLDNADGQIVHDPDSGFWYDKIIKVFRGVEFPNRKLRPVIGTVGFSFATANTVAKYLARLGVVDFEVVPVTSMQLPQDVDIFVAWSNGADLTAAQASIIALAYAQGRNVFTVSNFATSATVPLISTTITRSGTVKGNVTQPNIDTPFKNELQPYQTNSVNGELLISGIRSSASFGAIDTYTATTIYPVVYEANAVGGRWVHYQPTITDAITPSSHYSRAMTMLNSMISWLYSYADTRFWETQIGEFMIDKITEPRFPHRIQVAGRDYGKKLDLYKFGASTTFTAGQSIDSILMGIATNAGVTKFKVNSGGAVLSTTTSFDRAASGLEAFDGITQAQNLEYYFDRFGYLVVRPVLDPFSSPISLTLRTGLDGGNLVEFTKSSDDSELYNHIIVTGQDTDGVDVYSGEAKNTLPGSPTRIDRIGDRRFFYTSSFFTNAAQCQAYANTLLSVRALESFTFDFSSLVFPWVEVGEIAQVVDIATGYPTRYLLTDINLPLALEPMTGSSKRVAVVGEGN
jgi:hypothetical protein